MLGHALLFVEPNVQGWRQVGNAMPIHTACCGFPGPALEVTARLPHFVVVSHQIFQRQMAWQMEMTHQHQCTQA
jgi:hypothetical protein